MSDMERESEALAPENGRRSTDGSMESESGSSYIGSDEPERSPAPCAWRTRQFHDQECSRFFDCPSHIVARHSSSSDSERDSIASSGSEASSDIYDDDDGSARDDTITPQIDQTHDNDAPTEAVPQRRPANTAADASRASNTERGSLGEATPSNERSPGADALGPAAELTAMTQVMHDMALSQAEIRRRSTSDEPRDGRTDSYPGTPSRDVTLDRELPGLPYGHQRRLSTPSRQRMDAPLPSPRDRYPGDNTPRPYGRRHAGLDRRGSDFALPRWQPDAEVTYCLICHTQFSFFVRKHHCRKCGRVVCNACSPHRIIIPYQYIVHPLGSELSMPGSLLMDGLGAGYFDVNSMSGGERVRLCNPCVPDPNIAPPQSPASPGSLSSRAAHQRSRSNIGNTFGIAPSSQRYGAYFEGGTSNDPYRYYSPRTRSITMGPTSSIPSHASSSRQRSSTNQAALGRLFSGGSSSYHGRPSSPDVGSSSSSRQRALPPTPQIAEEDECPICHHELPSRNLPDWEALRENHITTCIQSHSTYGTPRDNAGEGGPAAAPRRTGMYSYPATEKDCVDDAECTICLEEFTVGVAMARLECLCRFHRSCITAWFVNHPGRCPVHQHDGFGY